MSYNYTNEDPSFKQFCQMEKYRNIEYLCYDKYFENSKKIYSIHICEDEFEMELHEEIMQLYYAGYRKDGVFFVRLSKDDEYVNIAQTDLTISDRVSIHFPWVRKPGESIWQKDVKTHNGPCDMYCDC